MKNFLIVLADLAIVFFTAVFVDVIASEYLASVAAGVITGAFVVKGWIERFWTDAEENKEEPTMPQSTRMLLVVGAIAISATGFEAINSAQSAEWEAEDAVDEVEDVRARVYELEDELGY